MKNLFAGNCLRILDFVVHFYYRHGFKINNKDLEKCNETYGMEELPSFVKCSPELGNYQGDMRSHKAYIGWR